MELEQLKLNLLIVFFSNSKNIDVVQSLIKELNVKKFKSLSKKGKLSNKNYNVHRRLSKNKQIRSQKL